MVGEEDEGWRAVIENATGAAFQLFCLDRHRPAHRTQSKEEEKTEDRKERENQQSVDVDV
jgi:hypothetical protein